MSERCTPSRPPRILVLSWIALMALLGLTVVLAYAPFGAFNVAVALAIATVKAGLVAMIFMELRGERGLTIVFAAAGFYWLFIMFWLSFADYTTRANFPQNLHLL